MKLPHALAIATLAAAAAPLPTLAQSVTLDFEGATSFASIAAFYAGGTDSAGQRGANLGISFGADALALRTDDPTLGVSNAPSGVTVMSGVGPDAFMNVASGFAGVLNFAYSSSDASAFVAVYSGFDGSGVQLARFALASNATTGCTDAAYCRFDLASIAFAGTARSVGFGASPFVAYDNVNVSLVPEPSSTALLLAGLGAVGFVACRRRG
jgi:hypothetical protein